MCIVSIVSCMAPNIDLGCDLEEDAEIADEHDDRGNDEDVDVDEGQVGLAVHGRLVAEDRLAEGPVRSLGDGVKEEQLGRTEKGRAEERRGRHPAHLEDNKINIF